VYPWVIDHVGHMNVHSYIARFDEASWHFLAHLGVTPQYMKSHQRGFVALEQNIRYKREVLAGSLLDFRTTLKEMGRKTMRLRHAMHDSATGEEVAERDLLIAFLDTAARRATPLPPEVRDKASSVMAPSVSVTA
jgi:acyl-CoA thioester hydrolase